MLDLASLSALIALCLAITGASIWALRAAKDDIKDIVKNSEQAVTQTAQAVKDEFKEFSKEVDRKLVNIHLHIDQKVESVKTNVRDVSLKTDQLSEKIHKGETDFLEFKVDLPDQFVTRREMDEFKKRVIRLEGPVWPTKGPE